jgi:two-component system response regulator AtoC
VPAFAPTRILIATHSRGMAETLAEVLAPLGHTLLHLEEPTEGHLEAALPGRVAADRPALVVLELKKTAHALAQLRLHEGQAHDRQTPVVVMLTAARPEVAFQASKLGADEMLLMSNSDEEVAAITAGVLSRTRVNTSAPSEASREAQSKPALSEVERVRAAPLPAAVPELKRRADDAPITGPGEHALFGRHPHMAEIRDTIAKVATTSATVLVRGESGVGKEIVARMIFERSRRAGKPFIKVNCAAIPHDLLESELFGYEAGAFTGATKAKPGKFELAHTGTLFLDEIAEMSPALQAKLLHVLQDGEFARLGAKQDIKVDVRLVCATNKLLEQRVAEGSFREDLFYRINVVTIHIPPLRERRDEIVPLIRHFLDKYAAQYGKPSAAFSKEAEEAMQHHAWPGNIRELENLCKRFVIVGGETQILREMAAHLEESRVKPALSSAVARTQTPQSAVAPVFTGTENAFSIGKRASLEAEAVVIRRALEETRWNRKEAARRLQMSYKTFLNRLKLIEAGGESA